MRVKFSQALRKLNRDWARSVSYNGVPQDQTRSYYRCDFRHREVATPLRSVAEVILPAPVGFGLHACMSSWVTLIDNKLIFSDEGLIGGCV
jgi:hypothetical protein